MPLGLGLHQSVHHLMNRTVPTRGDHQLAVFKRCLISELCGMTRMVGERAIYRTECALDSLEQRLWRELAATGPSLGVDDAKRLHFFFAFMR